MAKNIRVFPAFVLMTGGRVVRPYGVLRTLVVGDDLGVPRADIIRPCLLRGGGVCGLPQTEVGT